jgi:hypothetical protein
MVDSTTPRSRMTALTRRRIATGGNSQVRLYELRPPVAPCSVMTATANTDLVEINHLVG